MIEIAPEEYWIKCTFDQAIIYCTMLEIDGKKDWRLPTKKEFRDNIKSDHGWYNSDFGLYYENTFFNCVPVRDL